MFDWLWRFFATALEWLLDLLPDFMGQGWSDIASAFTPAASYFSWMFALDVVIPTTITAFIVRFVIRRIPGIG